MTDSSNAAPKTGFMARLRAGLGRTAASLSGGLTAVFTKKRLDADTVAALEEALIGADMGASLSAKLAGEVAEGRFDKEISETELRSVLAEEIAKVLKPSEKPFAVDPRHRPFVILIAGVNGTGKTTTIGKLAARLSADGHKVMLAACDTFRAAAIDQLKVWGERARATVVAREPGADAAGLAYDAFARARTAGADVLIVDTAGRLQNKSGLMEELEKIARVLAKLDREAPHAALLVLDATTGQNALSQVDAFGKSIPLTGLIMTKLDGTARGGILVAIAHRFGLPIYFIGVGEGTEDLQNFDARAFAQALTGAQQP